MNSHADESFPSDWFAQLTPKPLPAPPPPTPRATMPPPAARPQPQEGVPDLRFASRGLPAGLITITAVDHHGSPAGGVNALDGLIITSSTATFLWSRTAPAPSWSCMLTSHQIEAVVAQECPAPLLEALHAGAFALSFDHRQARVCYARTGWPAPLGWLDLTDIARLLNLPPDAVGLAMVLGATSCDDAIAGLQP